MIVSKEKALVSLTEKQQKEVEELESLLNKAQETYVAGKLMVYIKSEPDAKVKKEFRERAKDAGWATVTFHSDYREWTESWAIWFIAE
jgi:hypothetical protein